MKEGDRVTYYPLKSGEENLHFPATIVGFTRCRVRIKAEVLGHPEGKKATVSKSRLVYGQADFFEARRSHT